MLGAMLRIALLILAAAVAIAAGWSYHARGGDPPRLAPGESTVSFAGADGTLRGSLLVPARPNGHAVVLLSGFGPQTRDSSGIYRDWARALARRGFVTLRFDKRGIGESDGKRLDWLDPRILQDDARAALRWLQSSKDLTSVALLGHSQGGDIALVAGRGADRVVTVAAPGRPLSRLGGRAQLVSDIAGADVAEVIDSADPPSDARTLDRPLLIVHGTRDPVVPSSDARLLQAARPAGSRTGLIWLRDEGHNPLRDDDSTAWDQIARFLRDDPRSRPLPGR